MDGKAIIDTTPIVGPLFIGALLTWMLLGTLIVQVYWYSKRFSRDCIRLKLFVFSILFIEILQTIVSAWSVWALVIEHWGDVQTLENPPRVSVAAPIFSAGVAALVQSFYAWRIWKIGKSKTLNAIAILIVAIAIMQSTSCFISSAKFAIWDEAARLIDLRTGFTVWLVGSFAADILITASMLYILNKAKTTAFNDSNSILDRLIKQTVETSAVTVVCAGVELMLFLLYPLNDDHVAPSYVLGKLYSNCLLATLNSRTPTTPPNSACSSQSTRSGDRMHDAQTNMSIPTFAVRPPPPGYGNYDRRTSVRRSVRGRTWDIASESYGMDDIQSGDAAGVRRERWFDSEEALRVDVERETVIVIDVKDCEDQKETQQPTSHVLSRDDGSINSSKV